MFGIEHFFIFLSTAILLNLFPGPDSMYIIGRSISQGRAAGIFAVLGISSGSLFHTLLGAAGLSAIILSSAETFIALKYAGALYLFYQAYVMFRDSVDTKPMTESKLQTSDLAQIYKQGAITNILNPKVALFFMALLPQFISASSEHKMLAFMTLGLVFIATGTLWCLILAWFASYFSERLQANRRLTKWLLRFNAGLFGYLGIRLLLSETK